MHERNLAVDGLSGGVDLTHILRQTAADGEEFLRVVVQALDDARQLFVVLGVCQRVVVRLVHIVRRAVDARADHDQTRGCCLVHGHAVRVMAGRDEQNAVLGVDVLDLVVRHECPVQVHVREAVQRRGQLLIKVAVAVEIELQLGEKRLSRQRRDRQHDLVDGVLADVVELAQHHDFFAVLGGLLAVGEVGLVDDVSDHVAVLELDVHQLLGLVAQEFGHEHPLDVVLAGIAAHEVALDRVLDHVVIRRGEVRAHLVRQHLEHCLRAVVDENELLVRDIAVENRVLRYVHKVDDDNLVLLSRQQLFQVGIRAEADRDAVDVIAHVVPGIGHDRDLHLHACLDIGQIARVGECGQIQVRRRGVVRHHDEHILLRAALGDQIRLLGQIRERHALDQAGRVRGDLQRQCHVDRRLYRHHDRAVERQLVAV